MTASPADWSIMQATMALSLKQISSLELTEACLQRIAARNDRFAAFSSVYDEDARATARNADAQIASKVAGPLTGIPIGLKDVVGAVGKPLTADSAVLEGNIASQDATAWARLRAAGMVLIGHLHCGEFACGHWGANPWGPGTLSPGGSSSGNGIALAARMVPATIGSDGRGSIRGPAAFNGVTGIKPSFGLVSTSGSIPITFSYDVLGPMARSAADCALLLSAMVGPDSSDRTTLTQPPRSAYPTEPRSGPRPLSGERIGIPRFPTEPMSDGVGAVYERFQAELAAMGAKFVSFDWPWTPLESGDSWGSGDWFHVLGAEMQVIHEQFADRRELCREEFRRLSGLGSSPGSAVDYVRAQLKRAEYAELWRTIFADHRLTAVVHPVSQDEVFGTDVIETASNSESRMVLGGWNDANYPVVAVPAGLSPKDGSPVGMQIVGLPFTESTLIQIAVDLQARTDYHLQTPPNLDDGPPFNPPTRHESGVIQPPWVPVRNPFEPMLASVPDEQPPVRPRAIPQR